MDPNLDSTYHVFVYGTLRKGEYNHDLLKNARFLGNYTTLPLSYDLLDLGPFPGMVKRSLYDSSGASPVKGELYEVTGRLLKTLDRLEGHPDFFERTKIYINDFPVEVYAYLYKVDPRIPGQGKIPSGDWLVRD